MVLHQPLRPTAIKPSHAAVVTVNFNGLRDTIECLQSLAALDEPRPRVIVVDNGSEGDQASQIRDRFPWVTVLSSDRNLGWSGGNNLGVQEAFRPAVDADATPAELVLLLNNDTVVDPALIASVRQAIAEGFQVVGPVICDYAPPRAPQTEGTAFNRPNSLGLFSKIDTPIDSVGFQVTDVDIVNGCAVAFTRKVYDTIGRIDDRYFLICEESDYCLRAAQAGFRLGVYHQGQVFHKHSVSFARAGKPLQRYYSSRNLLLLLATHGGLPGQRSWARSMIFGLRHCYHLYCHERELANLPAAHAIVAGVGDAMLRRFGPKSDRFNPLVIPLRWFIASLWRLVRGFRSLRGNAARTT
jgi:GT2 family glycosyltransferase